MIPENGMYAQVIVNISSDQIDRPFQYRIPFSLEGKITAGSQVVIPFGNGNTLRKGYVVSLSRKAEIDPEKIKEIRDIVSGAFPVESQLISLAYWMKQEYGCTMIQALKTVMPVKEAVRHTQSRTICRCTSDEQFQIYLDLARKRNWKARVRLLEELSERKQIPFEEAESRLKMTLTALQPLVKAGVITIESSVVYRDPMEGKFSKESLPAELNPEQKAALKTLLESLNEVPCKPCLLHGITGSGKTEVYMNLIREVLDRGQSAIVLIPEISLTYQTVKRFYSRFPEMVSIVNSRLSKGERFDQFERARKGEIRIMIGPRSALFTPFENLGLIVMDEEQENAYNSDQIPRFHTRDAAMERARLAGALLVMGSATPSVEAYTKALKGEFTLIRLEHRAVLGSMLPEVYAVDLREELKAGNRSVFSRLLYQKMQECLDQKNQMMLFLNRRGYSKAVSCRSCGKPVGCPHCAVPLTEHFNHRMICHYCGYTAPVPSQCPACGSPYLAGFGLGTEKVEALVSEIFPQARILRMDFDTTSGKEGHEQILKKFAAHEADILIGTQMIVKGHDFPGVTLVGILAADMSLYSGDFRSGERTFQLLTQAAGRAGRGDKKGEVVIQTYDPENYSIEAAVRSDYLTFYDKEIAFRKMMAYPPCGDMCEIQTSSLSQEAAARSIQRIAGLIREHFSDRVRMLDPCPAPVAKIQDFWRFHMFIKTDDHSVYQEVLEEIGSLEEQEKGKKVNLFVASL